MAWYKDQKFLTHNSHTAFDALLHPGTVVSNSGIYRCTNCGREDACNKGNPLPPQNHHQHSPPCAILWQLIVCTQS
jgi:hypothetical protein